MKIGINAWVWIAPVTTESFVALVPKIAQMGFDWIEVPIDGLNDLDYRRAADVIREHSLGCNVCVAIGADRDLIHPDRATRANGAAYIRHCIDAVRILGGTNVVGPLYSAVGRLWQQTPDERVRDVDLLITQLTALSAYAHDSGAVLCLEPLNRFETSFVNLASQAVEIVDNVNSPACKLLLDTFHMNIEEKSLGDAIRLAGPRLAHVHACENDRGAPGTGHIDWQEVARALHDIDYQGPLVIESFTNQIKTIARAAAIWRAFEPSQDELGRRGLAFLRRLTQSMA
jgi:D-psicose/D-tagatose/L-ribulose 3-epimerase